MCAAGGGVLLCSWVCAERDVALSHSPIGTLQAEGGEEKMKLSLAQGMEEPRDAKKAADHRAGSQLGKKSKGLLCPAEERKRREGLCMHMCRCVCSCSSFLLSSSTVADSWCRRTGVDWSLTKKTCGHDRVWTGSPRNVSRFNKYTHPRVHLLCTFRTIGYEFFVRKHTLI